MVVVQQNTINTYYVALMVFIPLMLFVVFETQTEKIMQV